MTGGRDLVAIAFAHGLAIAVMIAATGHISGGLFNPALTIGLAVSGRLSPNRAGIYLGAEFAGAVVAALALKVIFKSSMVDPVELGTPVVGANFEVLAALLAEMILTFFLMYVVYGAAVDKRGANVIAPLAIGLTITAGIFAMGAVSGGTMNPALWFGPALVQGYWTDGWIYLVGPIVGAALAAVLYGYMLIDTTPVLDTRRTPPSQQDEVTLHAGGERDRPPARRRRRR
jgi:MIP family channel proteins